MTRLLLFDVDNTLLWSGGFGEESEDRAVIVRRAVERLGKGLPRAEAVVIGDTPHDISSAKANGAIAVGVATGTNSVEELRESGADVVFEDFSDWQPAAATLIGAQTGARPGGA